MYKCKSNLYQPTICGFRGGYGCLGTSYGSKLSIHYVNYVIFKIFSYFRRMKTYIRLTMRADWLNGSMLLNIHRNVKITPKKVIEKLIKKH